MKPVFKTTALAILVSLGVTACSGGTAEKVKNKLEEKVNAETDRVKNKIENALKTEAEKAQEEAEAKAKAEAEKAAAKAKALAEKAKDDTVSTAKGLADNAKTEVNKAKGDAKELVEQIKTEADKAKDELAKAQAQEKVVNEWRGAKSGANVVDPETRKSYELSTDNDGKKYVDGYEGTKEVAPVKDSRNRGYKLDYYQLAVEDKDNPQLLGWHKGAIESAGIVGSEITILNERNEIVERGRPEKIDYIFKNTPYATYGAVYNNYEANLFANYEMGASIFNNSYTTQIGEYEVIDGNKTTKIKYKDTVKGAATYTGEVVAQIERRVENSYYSSQYTYDKLPSVDGTITINANFGPRVEENYASATLDSKALGKVEFTKERMDLESSGIEFDAYSNKVNGSKVELDSIVVGKEADEIVGKLKYSNGSVAVGDVSEYKAVFAAQKQAK